MTEEIALWAEERRKLREEAVNRGLLIHAAILFSIPFVFFVFLALL